MSWLRQWKFELARKEGDRCLCVVEMSLVCSTAGTDVLEGAAEGHEKKKTDRLF
jgi:hypothetical protein